VAVEGQQHSAVEQKMLKGLKFCERCKGSIPESEFHDGHALHMGNKDVHVECLLNKGGQIPIVALVLAVAALGVGLFAMSKQGSGGDDSKKTATPEVTAADLQGALDRAKSAEGKATALEAEIQALKTETARLLAESRTQVAGERDTVVKGLKDEWSKAATAAEGRLAKAETGLVEIASLNGKFGSLSQALTDLRKDLATLKAKVDGAPKPP
jgi:uncharacterized protein HemX